MARIPTAEIDRIKREADLAALTRSRGIDLKKHGSKDLVGKCPFHEDCEDSPNFVVSPGKGLFHCMACGAAGNAIQFVEKFDGVSFRRAFEIVGGKPLPGDSPTSNGANGSAFTPRGDHILDEVADYYHKRLGQNRTALDYLASRGLDDEELVKRFRIGIADRTLGRNLKASSNGSATSLRSRLQDLGIFRKETGHEHFNGCVVVPVCDGDGHAVEMYGRRTVEKGKQRKGAPLHLYLPGKHAGIFNRSALEQREIILAESILDALTFVRHGMDAATCIFGTEGFTAELFEAIKASGVESVIIAYDADEAGDRAAKRDAEKLGKEGVICKRIKLPWGEDANGYAVAEGGDALRRAVRDAALIGEAKSPDSNKATPAPSSLAAEKLAADDGGDGAAKNKSGLRELTRKGEAWEVAFGDRAYRVGGLEKNAGMEALKLTLRLWRDGLFHVDQVDLCRDNDRRRFTDRAASECKLDPETVSRDLGKLLLAVEANQEERLAAQLEPNEPVAPPMSDDEREAALTLLTDPALFDKIGEAFDSAGIVGEDGNKLVAYLGCTSRLLAKPLAIIIQSTSAAGKTTLMEAALAFFPPEEQIKYSAMTGQSLYYLGETNLKHKILAIVEEEGAEKASYALKLLQSEGELTIASTGKDANTGRMETQTYHVEGPVAILLTTTSIDIDEELMNRCLILTVDESKEQTERIHALQRKARTLEGLRMKKQKKAALTLLQNMQRLLEPVDVVNDFAERLRFTSDNTRTRRDHEKYLTLIDTIALLHQHQRPREVDAADGEAAPFIRVTLEDIAIANAIAPEVLGRSLDELPPQTRRVLEVIKKHVAAECEAKEIDQDKCHFTRRTVREELGWSESQVRAHIQRLEDLEYIAKKWGRHGSTHVYELLIDCHEPEGVWRVGLSEPGELDEPKKRKPRKK